jgi:hypothetical protein
MTHPIADYSGINTRDSRLGVEALPENLRTGFRSDDGKIEGWLHEPTLQFFPIPDRDTLTEEIFRSAVGDLPAWERLEAKHPSLSTARRALQTAPVIPDLGSSLLHAWQGIEALFPNVSSEVSYRLSLLVAQLAPQADRKSTYRAARHSYAMRSQAAHGSFKNIQHADWVAAWDLLAECLAGCLHRGALPSEDDLITELLDPASGQDSPQD